MRGLLENHEDAIVFKGKNALVAKRLAECHSDLDVNLALAQPLGEKMYVKNPVVSQHLLLGLCSIFEQQPKHGLSTSQGLN